VQAMADTTPSEPDRASRPARQYRPSRGRRVGDAIIGMFIRAGLVPSSYLLTTRGRKTGRPRTNPVTVVEHQGKRWLVAPYGPVSWVHNARAAGQVTLRRRFEVQQKSCSGGVSEGGLEPPRPYRALGPQRGSGKSSRRKRVGTSADQPSDLRKRWSSLSCWIAADATG
jgi:F420H(2)-dependent quinone reductase